MNDKQHELDRIKRDYPDMYYIAAAVMLIGVGVAIGYELFGDHEGYFANCPLVLSIAVPVIYITSLATINTTVTSSAPASTATTSATPTFTGCDRPKL